jgi:hypothetical protein
MRNFTWRPTLQFRDVQLIRQRWAAKGSPACSHPCLEDEFIEALPTGDKVCTPCGKTFTPAELAQYQLKTGNVPGQS